MIRVAGYCRVSTDREDQANSFAAQQRYFHDYIRSRPDWELFDIYADEGISGTSTKKRTRFNRMISDACDGRFQLIITKEVSRFSRNILDTIAYTRDLRAMGIGVIFANDRINTLDPEAEMLLSLMASLAQEESRRTSARVIWGQTRQMERGVVFGSSLLGYDVKDGALTVNEEGAETVRLIFQKYAVEQMGTSRIAEYLTRRGCQTGRGSTNWTASAVIKILRNEKYTGDLVQKKTYTPDYLTHEKKPNKGQIPLVIIRDHHQPLVTREVWEMAQQRLERNNKCKGGDGGHSNRYGFSGKIRCGECAAAFVGRIKYLQDGTKIRRWSCASAAKGAKFCNIGKLVRDDDARHMLKTALATLPLSSVTEDVAALAAEVMEEGAGGEDPLDLRIRRLQQKREAALDSYFSREITKEDMQIMCRKYDDQLLCLRQSREEPPPQDTADIPSTLRAILSGEIESDVFCKMMTDSLTVFRDRHMELRLTGLSQVFWFT